MACAPFKTGSRSPAADRACGRKTSRSLSMATIRAAAQQKPAAAALLVPYLGWTTFAAILNGSIWYLNQDR